MPERAGEGGKLAGEEAAEGAADAGAEAAGEAAAEAVAEAAATAAEEAAVEATAAATSEVWVPLAIGCGVILVLALIIFAGFMFYGKGSGDIATGGSSTAPTGSMWPENVQASGLGWTLKDNTDYSKYACAPGTIDEGTYTHPTKGFIIRKCDTGLGMVASLISQRVIDMINAAQADGVALTGSSFRSYEAQKQLYEDHCSSFGCYPPTARPGNSMHERGLATDFNNATKGGAVWNWLSTNGGNYGYINLASEYWHWSMSGK